LSSRLKRLAEVRTTWITTSHKKNFAKNDWADGYLTETFVNVVEI